MKRVYSIENRCLDCKLCEVYCKTQHSKTGDIIKAWRWESPVPEARIRVEGDLDHSMAVQCRHCDEPDCVAACITGALSKDPDTGIVTVDKERCIGCRTCVAVCPYGAVHVNNGLALKCDLCSKGNTKAPLPACVTGCPNQALVFVESAV